MGTTRFTQLEVWKKAHAVAIDVYRLTQGFPLEERFLLTHQTRRAAVSIASNIAEGFGRRGSRDKAHFYTVSQGSAQELSYQLMLARDLGYIQAPEKLHEALDAVGAMLTRLIEKTLAMEPGRFR